MTARVRGGVHLRVAGLLGERVAKHVGVDIRAYGVSRSDRLIKTLGNRVGPDEITDVLLASKQVTEAAITTEP